MTRNKFSYLAANAGPLAALYLLNGYLLSKGVQSQNIFLVIFVGLSSAIDLSLPLFQHAKKGKPSFLVAQIVYSYAFRWAYLTIVATALGLAYMLAKGVGDVSQAEWLAAILLAVTSPHCFLLRGWADRLQQLRLSTLGRLSLAVPNASIAPLVLIGVSAEFMIGIILLCRIPTALYLFTLFKKRAPKLSRMNSANSSNLDREIFYLALGSFISLSFSGFVNRAIGLLFMPINSFVDFIYFADLAAKSAGFGFSIALGLLRVSDITKFDGRAVFVIAGMAAMFSENFNFISAIIGIAASIYILFAGQILLRSGNVAMRSFFPIIESLIFFIVSLALYYFIDISYHIFVFCQCILAVFLAQVIRTDLPGV